MPSADAEGLGAVHRAFVSRVPYEDLAVQLGEYEPLDEHALVQRFLHGGRGGYCFEANTVLCALLRTLGFEVERREGIVAHRDAHRRGELTNHMALVVQTPDGGSFIAEAGLGEGPLDPLPLRPGVVTAGAFELTIERDRSGWWIAQHPHGSIPGFWFSRVPAALDAFQPHHLRLSTSVDSSFVQTLVVQRPFDDRIVTLRARTMFVDAPGRHERSVLEDRSAFAETLHRQFGIDPDALGEQRFARLWAKANQQHDARQTEGAG
ncbi:MAG: arylamine N-acetyltransferase family protein [Solirubrobacteraceae bacterium]